MKNKKANVLLSIWISVSFVLAVIGIIVIESTITYNTYQEEEIVFWNSLTKAGNIITLIGVISTFLSCLFTILVSRITKKENTETKTIKINTLTLTKVFAITFICVSVLLIIANITLLEYIKSTIQKADIEEVIQFTNMRGIVSMIAIYALPIFAIIETILIFLATKKPKVSTTKQPFCNDLNN